MRLAIRRLLNPGRSSRSVMAMLGAVAATLALSACSAVRNDLGTSNSPCYVAVPAATGAVHRAGSLAGVRLVRVRSLQRFHLLYQVAGDGQASNRRVCLVAFRGHFEEQRVSVPQRGKRAGAFAVVVLSYPDGRVLGTVILRHPPVAFGHSHLL